VKRILLNLEELDNILYHKLLVIEPVTEKDWDKAIIYSRKYNYQQIDLTDCLSFAVMERLEMKNVLTSDNDFKIHGFELYF